MNRLAILSTALGLCFLAAESAKAQCPLRSASSGASRSAPSNSTGSSSGFGGGGGGGGGRLLTGPGSHFHDLMLQNYARQRQARQQAMVAAYKQAKKNTRKQKQLETRKKQRAAELARREERKKQARALAAVASPNKSSGTQR